MTSRSLTASRRRGSRHSATFLVRMIGSVVGPAVALALVGRIRSTEGGQPLTWHTPLTFALVLVGWGQDLQMMGQTRTNFGTIRTLYNWTRLHPSCDARPHQLMIPPDIRGAP